MTKTLSAALCAMLLSTSVLAETPKPEENKPAPKQTSNTLAPQDVTSEVTVHSVAIGAALLIGVAALGGGDGDGSSGTTGTTGTN